MEWVHGKLGQVERVLKLCMYLFIWQCFFFLFKTIPHFGRERKHTSAQTIKLVTVLILVKKVSPQSLFEKLALLKVSSWLRLKSSRPYCKTKVERTVSCSYSLYVIFPVDVCWQDLEHSATAQGLTWLQGLVPQCRL